MGLCGGGCVCVWEGVCVCPQQVGKLFSIQASLETLSKLVGSLSLPLLPPLNPLHPDPTSTLHSPFLCPGQVGKLFSIQASLETPSKLVGSLHPPHTLPLSQSTPHPPPVSIQHFPPISIHPTPSPCLNPPPPPVCPGGQAVLHPGVPGDAVQAGGLSPCTPHPPPVSIHPTPSPCLTQP